MTLGATFDSMLAQQFVNGIADRALKTGMYLQLTAPYTLRDTITLFQKGSVAAEMEAQALRTLTVPKIPEDWKEVLTVQITLNTSRLSGF
ncbi:hypothetical protein BDZ91DRAFT_710347 [Kalaharituber pfeilii]|nr:hypothetical protein BDZ91DRAFT_710347 [Kalaharituber pfeilii]